MFGAFIPIFGLYFAFSETVVPSSAHITTNSNDLQNLLDYVKNSDLFTSMADFIQREETNIELIKYLTKPLVDEESLEPSDVLQSFHPGMAFKLFRGRAIRLPVALTEIQERSRTNWFDETSWTVFLSQLSNASDLGFIIKGLVRLMDVYKLKPNEVEKGHILRHRSRGLNLEEIADIGLISKSFVLADAVDGDMINVIMGWLYLGSSRAKAVANVELRYEIEVALLEITRFIFRRDDCHCSTDMINAHNMWKRNNPGHPLPPSNWTCDANKRHERCMKNLNRNTREHENFFSICQHKQPIYFTDRHIHLPVRDQYCKLAHNNHPLLMLQPIKLEIRSPEYPYNMIEFHDILTDNEMDYFMQNAGENMTRGTINTHMKQNQISDRRVGENAHLPFEKHESPVMRRIWARLSAISNLTMSLHTTERLRLATYATTGYFSSHIDFLMNRTLEQNNRHVTFLLYLNDVDGGETVFPFINIRVDARRGKGFMFNNLFRNTTGMMDSRHGSCPVITGDKWIVTHWVYRYGQEFSHKCSLNQFE